MEKCFEIIARVLVVKNGKILVCQAKERDYYFLPGGHVEIGETSKEAIKREMKEERGSRLEDVSFIGVVENVFEERSKEHYEINIVFRAEEKKSSKSESSKESHILFKFLDVKDFKKCDLRPLVLKKSILKYLQERDIFWAAEKEKKRFK